MSAADLLKADMDGAVGGFFGESVGYKALSGVPEASIPWTYIPMIVDESPEVIGVSGDRGRSPIVVVASKTDLAAVTEGVDKIYRNSRTYVVEKIISEDPGGWELYCL